MTELINRFTEAEKAFIDGMTSRLSFYLDNDLEVSEFSTSTIIAIFDFCITRFTHVPGLQMEVDRRYDSNIEPEDLYDDLYDKLYKDYYYFFESLAESN